MYFPKMTGEKCYLSPIDPADAATYTKWVNNIEVTRNLNMATFNLNEAQETEMLNRLSKEHNYAIVEKETDRLIGTCGLMDPDYCNRSAEIGIFIGDKGYWNRGFGTEALCLLIDYAFQYLNLDNIMLRVYDFNKRAQASYGKAGFKYIGKRRNALKRHLTAYDIIFMDVIPEDFYKTYPSKLGPE